MGTITGAVRRVVRSGRGLLPSGQLLTPKVWERDVLPRRAGAYSPGWMDQLCASGELVWVGAGALGRKTGFDYALFMYAEDNIVSGGRVALQVLGIAGCFVGFCAPNIGGGGQFAYASLVDLKTGEVVWFNVVQTGSQIAGIKMGDIRTPQGAAQLVDRLVGRMKPGREVRRAMERR